MQYISGHLDASSSMWEGEMDKSPQWGYNNQLHKIILALDLTASRFNDILTIDFLEI